MDLKQRLGLAVVSGLLGVLAFPPVGWWPVALVAWVVWWVALRGAGWRAGVYVGLAHGVVLYGVSLSWLWNLFQQGAVGLWILLALFTGFSGWVAGGVSRRFAGVWWVPFFAALTYGVVSHFRAEWFVLRFPWMTPGLGLGPTWLSPWIGVYGVGTLVVLAEALVVMGGRRQRVAGVVMTAGLGLLGWLRPGRVEESGVGVRVLAVQSENCDFETYRQMSAGAEFADGLILWPEYAAPMFRQMPKDRAAVLDLLEEKRSVLVFGTTKQVDEARHWNEALTMDAGGEVGSHFKNRPVHFMNDGEPGTVAMPVETRFGKVGTPICFDCDYESTVRRMTAAGAEFFAVPSMDARHWSVREHEQHAELFRHRALENGRWMAVCATSGMTQVIDPNGNRVAALPLMEDGVMEGRVWPREGLTFYTKLGWRLPQVMTAGWGVWVVCLLVGARRGGGGREPRMDADGHG
jgi:apolipoprotein N-acyltransferase